MSRPTHNMKSTQKFPLLCTGLAFAGLASLTLLAVEKPELPTTLVSKDRAPMKIMLITGGCCHDYATQKDLLKNGIEKRLNAVVDQIHTDDKGVAPPLPILGNPDYANGYDLVIHDECAAGVADANLVAGVLAPHKAGIPAVNLHCAMHSYRVGDPKKAMEAGAPEAAWFDYLGLQSSSHGPQEPVEIILANKEHPANQGVVGWTTGKEELYNNVVVRPGIETLATGKQVVTVKKKQPDGTETAEQVTKESIVTWTNLYGEKKTRVFSTTIGHQNETVGDERYVQKVTQGILWATGSLDDKGQPLAGVIKATK